METHHFVPMKWQSEIDADIDVPENIISLCPTCHQLLHRAVDAQRRVHIDAVYQSRHGLLKERGIEISLERVLGYYGVRIVGHH